MSISEPVTPVSPAGNGPPRSPEISFPIVGIGASAGGLEAVTELLADLPADTGMAFLFVPHLEPHHKSQLAHILSRVTPMPVLEATEGMPVEPNHFYLLPPNTNIALVEGKWVLTPRSQKPGPNMPADHLFRSLALSQKEQAIGIILSGGGTDGTLGFQTIKAEGGITFAQDERSARQSSMPRSAIADGNVDYVLPPAEIAHQLVRLRPHLYLGQPLPAPEADTELKDGILEIIKLLRARTGVDFSHYKQSTIQRRVQRRLALRGLDEVPAYFHLLREDANELNALYQDFLIRVTQFFRDPEAFEVLKDLAFPALIRRRQPNMPIRIWAAGCATGEEVYSLAICLLEYLEASGHTFPIKILATDLSEAALEKARSGMYVDNIEIDVSPERLRRFFVRGEGHYQILKSVRDLCIFSRHNMAADPPFSRLDLISCRNVLIYMDVGLQKRVLSILHYALNPDCFLFLGPSENIAASSPLFDAVDPRHRLFSKKATAHLWPLEFTPAVPSEGGQVGRSPLKKGGVWTAQDVQKEADRLVLARYAPVGVVVDETGTVLQFRGRTAPYLEPAPGMASLDLMRMLREGLLVEVRLAFNQVKIENVAVVREPVPLVEDGKDRLVRIEVLPLKPSPEEPRLFLILFQDVVPPAPARPAPPEDKPQPRAEQERSQLQQELTAMRDYLQSVIEEQESTNEELKSANEEILSANEELQSTNEELQTAKEEAQSANEELATVNEELQHRNADLARVNNDLINLLSGVHIPIVMVSRDLSIRRFTPQAQKLFNLIPTDVGRPISDIKPNLDIPDLIPLLNRVIETLAPHESEVRDKDGHSYSLRIRPYITLETKIDGASIVLLDIDALTKKRTEG